MLSQLFLRIASRLSKSAIIASGYYLNMQVTTLIDEGDSDIQQYAGQSRGLNRCRQIYLLKGRVPIVKHVLIRGPAESLRPSVSLPQLHILEFLTADSSLE